MIVNYGRRRVALRFVTDPLVFAPHCATSIANTEWDCQMQQEIKKKKNTDRNRKIQQASASLVAFTIHRLVYTWNMSMNFTKTSPTCYRGHVPAAYVQAGHSLGHLQTHKSDIQYNKHC